MDFFNSPLTKSDKAVAAAIEREHARQRDQIELIASENLVSRAVMDAQGCLMTNKYAEGYPGKRYYGGCEYVDEVERLAMERACELFAAPFANVQPHSGSQANQAVFMSALKPGDKVMGMALDQGGHLTHGSKVNLSGKWFEAHFYGLSRETEKIDYDEVERLALEVRPRLIIAGASAYPHTIDFERFAHIAEKAEALLLVDMAHIAGLVASGAHPSPLPWADFVTTTTHKTLRGPRGGMVLTKDEKWAKKVNSALFPGLQGGPLMHIIAAKAVALGEALTPAFKEYIQQVVTNAAALAESLSQRNFRLVGGGTDTHLLLLDLRNRSITGKAAEAALERAGLTCNKNAVPFDEESPMVTSGIRLGTPAATSRGFGEHEFRQIGAWIWRVLDGLTHHPEGALDVEQAVREEVSALCTRFPIYERAV